MSGTCDGITLKTNCESDTCFACQRVLFDTTCVDVSLTTNCAKDKSDNESCYIFQNFKLQDTITNGNLANSLAQGKNYDDAYFTYWNEISKTIYVSVGILGILTCSYYIR